MKYEANSPIYLQVVNAIKLEIINGKISPGEKLPSGRDLALLYTINPNTSARVYQELESQGICYTKRGMGTYVTEDIQVIHNCRDNMAKENLYNFLTNLYKLGISKEEAIDMINEANDICIL